ncbi:uncharacterized protein LOC129729077 [Wyeomyia smithii]|uniref:uncharacterized protein LOC129729077 n=1 Tax=Wyeomyia smithii TaxID=174621 RepID=UPI002467CEF4|nr:uncharacterized protein LOC129729077 [Wyeomyia smithii]
MYHPFWRNPYVLWTKSTLLVVQDTFEQEHIVSEQHESIEDDYFHAAIAPVLKISQLFGVFPLSNVMERLPEKLCFKATSLTCFISSIVIFGGYFVSVLSVKRFAAKGINIINIAEPFFFAINATSTALFWQLAKQWSALLIEWQSIEKTFLRNPFRRLPLKRKIRTIALVVLLLALVEHLLSIGNNVSNIRREAKICNWTITEPFKYFCLKTYTSAFSTISYNLPVAIYNEYIVLSMTFAWNFVDLFVVLVSIGLSIRFNQLNRYIADRIDQPKPTSEDYWERIRIHYVSLCELVEMLNRSVSRLVFVSYANDLYFICLQIMNASQEQPFLINKIYFTYSFIFLLLRAFLMFWYSAQVQDASHQPCKLALRVPNEEYCNELERVQMYSKRGVSLTGMGVFLVSRKILLTITGTIITYELVLLAYRRRSDEEQSAGSTDRECEPLQLTTLHILQTHIKATDKQLSFYCKPKEIPEATMKPLNSFNEAMRPVILTFQLMGTFPMSGLFQRDSLAIRFKWFSIQTVVSLVFVMVGLLMCYIEYERLEKVGVNARNIIGILFYIDTVIIMALMVNLARRWRSLATKWRYVDSIVPITGKSNTYLRVKIKWTAWMVILCALVEHMLSKTADVYNQYREAQFCHWDVRDFPRYFASRHYSFVFKHVNYNILILMCFEYANAALTMAWTCQDLMIILVSLGLITYFKHIHEKIRQFANGIMIANEQFWIEIRSQYVQLCDLVDTANNLLASLIISSCGTNLYLICFQLLNISRKEESLASAINHWYSLIYLISKTALVFYTASMVNEAALAPRSVCIMVPNIGWCLELDRFACQLRTARVALSGMGFFHLTKRTMMAMAGTVATYELVMLKFAENTEGIGDVAPCSALAFSKDV